MLFFRSEEALGAWCEGRRTRPGPTVPIHQLWRLAKVWYGTRLDPDVPRPTPDEARRMLVGAGLADPFWDPTAPEEPTP